ncbi:Ku protein [Rhizobium tumorigenes]|uniref:Non-homologous end joining protein Ku n=1 Tax=Rhizobium tumorigenes TaxID=2041385 RepID=A0AAF1K570_9HYPH|nr:Ku protein [Rhizobium tumorigenes]WFR95551.1 Ku protein [Rhizobium tumorigenes]
MAKQPRYWKGYLKLSLVTCQVSLTPATTDNAKIRFNVINRKSGNRLESHYIDSGTGKPVTDDQQVKGYERGDDDYVFLEDEEIEAVALESNRAISIDTFVPKNSIDWIYYDAPHFLAPEDKVGMEAFCVIREAMKASGVVGIARLVLNRRERAVLLEPSGNGIILWTLRYGDEVREPEKSFAVAEKPEAEALALMKTLIEKRKVDWSAELTLDPVQDKLAALIMAKKKGRSKKPAAARKEAPATSGNVINIMDALKKSIEANQKTKGK